MSDHQLAYGKGLEATDALIISHELQSVPDYDQEAWVVQVVLSAVFGLVNTEVCCVYWKTLQLTSQCCPL